MFTGNSLSVTGIRIAFFSKSNENNLGESLIRLASGKKVNSPADSIPDYFYSEKMRRESRSYGPILRNIGEGIAFVDVAVSAGEQVFGAVTDMRELARQYYDADTSADDRGALAAEFNALRGEVTGIISASRYDGMQVISANGGAPFKSISLDDINGTHTMDIGFAAGDIVNVSALTLGTAGEAAERAAIESELEKAGSYLASASAYMRGLNAQYAIATNKMNVSQSVAERSVESDIGEEMIRSMNFSIRNESSLAMMAQANMYSASVIKLLGW